jgi:serine/threonine protein kinase
MNPELTGDSDREERRNHVLLAYVEALEEGREPDRAQLLAAHPDLRQDLEAFLAGHDEVTRLAAPLRAAEQGDARGHVGPTHEEPDDTQPGIGELGDFRLLREVGRGGMGVVYEAEQISLRRRVALNVLPFAAAIDPRRLQRFKTEALAAAHVQHERIVPVHAVGCERGVHYYAMQFIERDRNALIRQIADDDPRPPRSLDQSIPSELETIVLKALRKDPADRYGTAQELADDLITRSSSNSAAAIPTHRPSCGTPRGGSRRSSPIWRCCAPRASSTC